jgi:hypothetical protein
MAKSNVLNAMEPCFGAEHPRIESMVDVPLKTVCVGRND